MTYNTSRPNLTSIAAACILSGGLITAAIIDSHKTVASTVETASVTGVTPPIAQDSAQKQFESQIAAQAIKPMHASGMDFGFKGVQATKVVYTPKDDAYTFIYNSRFETMGGNSIDAIRSVTLSNDGYGHYYGSASLDDDSSQYADVTIR